jgi:CspA family cold shock protein
MWAIRWDPLFPGGTAYLLKFFFGSGLMAEGTIKRLTDKGFGFIDAGTGQDMFFHMSNLEGVSFEELREGQRVSFTEGQGPKGPRAENVQVI